MNQRIEQLRSQLREDSSSRLFFQLGELLRRCDEHEEAAEVLRKGLENYPRYVAAWVSLGRTLFELSSFQASEMAFEKAMMLDPENPIAARMLGEAAMGREDWLQAIKHLKLARVFSPRDEAIEENIHFVEQRLSEAGELVGEPTAEPLLADDVPDVEEIDPEVIESHDDTANDAFDPLAADDVPDETPFAESDRDESTSDVATIEEPSIEEPSIEEPTPAKEGLVDPENENTANLIAGESDPFDNDAEIADAVVDEPETQHEEDPFALAPEPKVESTGDDVFSLSDDDPFEREPPTGDTGVFMLPEDVFGEPAEEESTPERPEELADFEGEPQSLMDEKTIETPEISEQFDAVAASCIDDFPQESVDEAEASIPDEALPIPTVTLARLALEQGDRELAQQTLENVLLADPGNVDAGKILAEMTEILVRAETNDAQDLPAKKIAALQGWLSTLRMAAEDGTR